jgi:quercetin dioxygenase-like cupin family protein
MHVVGSLSGVVSDLGPFEGRSDGLTRRPLVDRAAGSVHQALVHCELAPGGHIDRHLHAFEEAVYVLTGTIDVTVSGAHEQLAADDFLWIEVGVPHALVNNGSSR